MSSVALVLSFGTGLVVAGAGPAGAAVPATGWIRFGHFVPSQGPVDVMVGTTVLGTDLVFRSVTPYFSVPSGNQTVTVRASGGSASAPPLVVGQADVPPAGAVTAAAVAASDTTSSLHSAGAIELQMFADDLSAPAPGQAKVRVIHTVPGTATVSAQLTDSVTPAATAVSAEPTLTLSPVGYGDASPYEVVAAGTYQLKVGPPGGAPIVTGQNWPIRAGTVSSVVLVASTSGPTVEVLSDAVGTATAPVGSMQTGFGGTAPRPGTALVPIAAIAALLLFGAALIRRRRVTVI
jgi:MYXO-CTERM domain-containing protein